MSKINFYCLTGSPSSRCVVYVAEQLCIDLNVLNVDFNTMSEENWKINPARTTMLDDDGTLIYGSSPIMIYLVEKYGITDDLYPKDLVRRANVNSMLFFEAQFLFGRLRAAVEPIFETDQKDTFEDYLFSKVADSLDRLERILLNSRTDFIADNSITICDFACISTLVSMEVFLKFDEARHPMITQWRNRLYAAFPEMERIEKQNADDFKILLEEVHEMRKFMVVDKTKIK